jgi:hypothetical protein
MSSTIAARSYVQRTLVVLGTTIALLVGWNLTAGLAEPRPDPGLSVVAGLKCGPFTPPLTISVERVGNHLVRCDYLVR